MTESERERENNRNSHKLNTKTIDAKKSSPRDRERERESSDGSVAREPDLRRLVNRWRRRQRLIRHFVTLLLSHSAFVSFSPFFPLFRSFSIYPLYSRLWNRIIFIFLPPLIATNYFSSLLPYLSNWDIVYIYRRMEFMIFFFLETLCITINTSVVLDNLYFE